MLIVISFYNFFYKIYPKGTIGLLSTFNTRNPPPRTPPVKDLDFQGG